jgi:hypothetical protein
MLRTHGVTSLFDGRDFELLKQKALLFDTIYLSEFRSENGNLDGFPDYIRADIEYLQERGVVATVPDSSHSWLAVNNHDPIRHLEGICDDPGCEDRKVIEAVIDLRRTIDDTFIRVWAARLAPYDKSAQFVPLCRRTLTVLRRTAALQDVKVSPHDVLSVALEQIPVPSEDSSWDSIIDFKSEMGDKLWDFRRFIRDVATKRQSIAEIQDDIEWSLHQYEEAMRLHKLKAANSFVEVYLIPVVEVVEDLAKFNWSKIGKGMFSVNKRTVELLEAEMKAPGRECAYAFKAQERFGSKK